MRNSLGETVAVYAVRIDAREFTTARTLLIAFQLVFSLAISIISAIVSRRVGSSLSSRLDLVRRWLERL